MKTLSFQLTEKSKRLLQENCRHIQTEKGTGYDAMSLKVYEEKCQFCGKVITWKYI